MNSNQVVSLGSLEADLGLSRVDLLLIIRELGIEQIKQGMRTWIRQEEANRLYQHLGKSNPREPLVAEVVPISMPDDAAALATTTGNETGDEELRKYSKLKLLRERIELLDLLQSTEVELASQEICTVLDIKRLPPTNDLGNDQEGFRRMGLKFIRIKRDKHRTSWKVSRSN